VEQTYEESLVIATIFSTFTIGVPEDVKAKVEDGRVTSDNDVNFDLGEATPEREKSTGTNSSFSADEIARIGLDFGVLLTYETKIRGWLTSMLLNSP